MPVMIRIFIGAHPAGEVYFINAAGHFQRIVRAAVLHPVAIAPVVFQVPGNGRRVGALLPEIGIRIAFIGLYTLETVDMIFIYFAFG